MTEKALLTCNPLCEQMPLPAGRICSSAFSTMKLKVRASVVRICLQNARPPHGENMLSPSRKRSSHSSKMPLRVF